MCSNITIYAVFFCLNVWKLTYYVSCQPWYSQKQWHLHGFSLKFACIGYFAFKIFILDFKKAIFMVKYFKCSYNKNAYIYMLSKKHGWKSTNLFKRT